MFGVRVHSFELGMLLLVFTITMAALYALGMTLASLFLLFGREAWHLCNALQEPVYFLSGLYFPLRTLGALRAGRGRARAARASASTRCARCCSAPPRTGLMPLGRELAILTGLAAAFLVLARVSLAHLECLSKREGRLTQRWQ